MNEEIIISLTSWTERINNVPVVLDTIYAQTMLPDRVVVNLSRVDFPSGLPHKVSSYLDAHNVEIIWHDNNTKVWKKFLPTLEKYPKACVICIDDDTLYPPTMIEEFMSIHKQFPDDPISGNHYSRKGIKCHCGCASLVMKKHFEGYKDFLTENLILQCTSSDMFYTYMAAYNGYFYKHTNVDYQQTAETYNPCYGYSDTTNHHRLGDSERALYNIFGLRISKNFDVADSNKPYCVFGSAQTEMGVEIEKRMLEWLDPNFNLFIVRHNGTTYEYAAIRFLKMMADRLNKPFFYLHTKGAYYKRKLSHRVRRMWNFEFVGKQQQYLNLVDTDKPAVAAPYSGVTKVTWYNGWCANAAACRIMPLIKTDDRFYYEYRLFQKAKVVGVRMNNVDFETRRPMHDDLKINFD